MDTIQIKTPRKLPLNSPYFQEEVRTHEIQSEYLKGSRFVYTNNTWRKEQMAQGIYTPKYWIAHDFKNPDITYFVLEASIPKMLWGHNFKEVTSEHKEDVIKALQDFTKKVGMNLFSRAEIRNATPTVLAVGRNINITKLCSCFTALRALSLFNDRFRSTFRKIDFESETGAELYFNNKSTTFKVYDKTRQVLNKPVTTQEHEIASYLQKERYKQNTVYVREMLRFELTMRKKGALKSRLKPLLNGKPLTFENVFDKSIWDALLKKEIDAIYNHPLADFAFLALEERPRIEAIIDAMHKHLSVKAMIWGIVESIQSKGLQATRQDVHGSYRSRQTWYNYVRRLEKIGKQIDYTEIDNLTQLQIHSSVLKNFGIKTERQQTLNLNFVDNQSKKID